MKKSILTIAFLLVAFASKSNNFKNGYEAYNKGDFQTAKQLFTQALQSEPNSAELYYNLALAEYKLEQFAQAEKDLQKAKNLVK